MIDDFTILIYKENLKKRLIKVYEFISSIMSNNYAIVEKIENENFDSISFRTSKMILLFCNYDYWLFLVTCGALHDLGIVFQKKEYLEKYYLEVTINKTVYNIFFNDSTVDYRIPKVFDENIFLLVSTKNIHNTKYHTIKYHYNYCQFKSELLEYLVFRI